MPNVMAAQPNTGGALCSTPQFGCAVTLPRSETRWNLLGCPKLTKWSQPLVGRSSPYCKDMWGRYCCLTTFSPIVDTCLNCGDIARQSCAMVRRWQFFYVIFASCILREHHISDLHSNFALRPHHLWKYGRHPISDCWEQPRKTKRRRKKVATAAKYNVCFCYAGRP